MKTTRVIGRVKYPNYMMFSSDYSSDTKNQNKRNYPFPSESQPIGQIKFSKPVV